MKWRTRSFFDIWMPKSVTMMRKRSHRKFIMTFARYQEEITEAI